MKLFDSYNSQIYGLIRQNRNSPIQAKGDIIVLADGWKGSVRWHPKSLSVYLENHPSTRSNTGPYLIEKGNWIPHSSL